MAQGSGDQGTTEATVVTNRLYKVKRKLRAPLIWYGRRRNAGEPQAVRDRLELNGYRKVAKTAMIVNGIDPDYYYRADLDASAVVVDVGAHVGEVAEKLVSLYGCEVHAYEPNPVLYAHLEKRAVADPRIHAHPVGLGATDATLQMEQRGLGSTVYGHPDGSVPVVDVQIRDGAAALDELGVERIDYLKMNIEGAEYDLLDRLVEAGWIDRSRYVLVQFHEWYAGAHYRRWRLRRKLRKTHEQIWNYPWIYELWCAKSQPHPQQPKLNKEQMAELRAALAAKRAERERQAVAGGVPAGH